MKILVLGGSGLVGSRFIELSSYNEIISPSHNDLDLLDLKKVEDFIKSSDAEVVINFAAFTNVDAAQEEKDNEEGLVYKLNVKVPEILARVCYEQKKQLIHISTDYIFDGTKPTPYKEDDNPNPLNWYGKTKMLGEDAVKEVSKDFLIVRLEMPYSSHFEKKLDLARVFIKMLKEGKTINGVVDQKITPTFVDSFVNALIELIKAGSSGIYHIASTDSTTPYDFAMLIAQKFGLDKDLIKSVPFAQYNHTRTAKRPQNSALDVTKFITEFGHGILTSNKKSVDKLFNQINQLSN